QIRAQDDLGVLRDHTQQGEAGGVHGVVDGGAEPAQQLELDTVHDQMDLTDPLQLAHCALGVPQGGGVVGGDDQSPVGPAGGQPEASAETGGGVDQDVVVHGAGGVQQGADLIRRQAGGQGHG